METDLIELFTNPRALCTYYYSQKTNIVYKSDIVKVTDLNGTKKDINLDIVPMYELKNIKEK